MRIVADERVARFVSGKLGIGLCPPYSTLGIERVGEIVGGVVFNFFEGTDLHVTIAGCGWTRGFIKAAGDYVFNQLGCERMTATTERPEVVGFAQRLGGQIEGRLRSHFGRGRDAVVIGILRDEWRY